MIRPEHTRHLTLAPAPVTVVVANGAPHINRGGTSIEIPFEDIDRVVAALLVAADTLEDAR